MKSPLRSSSLFGYRSITWEEAELKIFITYALIYMSVLVSCFCLGWKCCVIRRVCLSGSFSLWDLSSTSSHLFSLFSYSFLCVVLEEGPDFFHSQCKTVQRTESPLCESHILVSPPSEEFWKGVWKLWEAVNLVWAPKFVQAGDVKCTHASCTASGY